MPRPVTPVTRLASFRPTTLIALLWLVVAGLNLLLAAVGGFDTNAGLKVTVTSLIGFLLSLLVYAAARRTVVESTPASLVLVLVIAFVGGTTLWGIDTVVQASQARRLIDPARITAYAFNLRYNWVYFLILFLLQAALCTLLISVRILDAREKQLVDARLAALRFQLNPHFMFNTLNALGTLVAEAGATRAEEMIIRLSDFLRASLSADPTDLVPLAQELETVQAYLSIESVRFGERLQVHLACEPGLGDAQVPSLLLQPLIENAMKHAVAPSKAPVTVTIRAQSHARDLVLTVDDDVENPSASTGASGTGVGLRNVAERLDTLYGARASMETARHARGFMVVLRLPLGRSR